MKEQFVTYEIALKLKELGFDESCFGYYGIQNEIKYEISYNSDPNLQKRKFISAPLWQQVIDWFREKYDIVIQPIIFDKGFLEQDKFCYQWHIYFKSDNPDNIYISPKEWKTYYEAREQAILKAIELCQKEK